VKDYQYYRKEQALHTTMYKRNAGESAKLKRIEY